MEYPSKKIRTMSSTFRLCIFNFSFFCMLLFTLFHLFSSHKHTIDLRFLQQKSIDKFSHILFFYHILNYSTPLTQYT
nr:MAG TPA: hypothetical protein [Caudoviricetes sp.]